MEIASKEGSTVVQRLLPALLHAFFLPRAQNVGQLQLSKSPFGKAVKKSLGKEAGEGSNLGLPDNDSSVALQTPLGGLPTRLAAVSC